MNLLLSLLLLCGPAAAQQDGEVEISVMPAPPRPEAPPAPRWEPVPAGARASALVPRYLEAVYPEEKAAILKALGDSKPRTVGDMRALMALNNKEDSGAAAQIARSIARLSTDDRRLGSFLLSLLEVDEPRIRMFALLGIERVRPEGALKPLMEKARTRFKKRRLRETKGREESEDWLYRFQCLRVLALWKGKEMLPLLRRRAKEAPRVAEIIAAYFWTGSFDEILDWSESRREKTRELAHTAWRASVPVEELRKTRGKLLEIVLDPKMRGETRHQAAVKLGLSSREDEVDALLDLRAKARRKKTRLFLEAAIFASRSPKAVPLLKDYVKTDTDPLSRAGALAQLSDLIGPADYAELLRWVAENDADVENRRDALRQLRSTKSP